MVEPDVARAKIAAINRLDAKLAGDLRKMAGFRNIVVHRYAELDGKAVEQIADNHLSDLRRFAGRVVQAFGLDR